MGGPSSITLAEEELELETPFSMAAAASNDAKEVCLLDAAVVVAVAVGAGAGPDCDWVAFFPTEVDAVDAVVVVAIIVLDVAAVVVVDDDDERLTTPWFLIFCLISASSEAAILPAISAVGLRYGSKSAKVT